REVAAMDPPAIDRSVAGQAADILRALKFSNEEIGLASTLVGVAHLGARDAWTEEAIRRALALIDRDRREATIALWASAEPANVALVEGAREALARHYPLAIADLAIGGKDLMSELRIPAGRH